jgi:hypothetical protein
MKILLGMPCILYSSVFRSLDDIGKGYGQYQLVIKPSFLLLPIPNFIITLSILHGFPNYFFNLF